VFPDALDRVLALPEDALVLDVGGWAGPVNRADWVIDLMPYASRGALMPDGFGPGPERFSADRWVISDICGATPWPFADDFFDFAICTFTLEDVRDPIRVCAEMSRVAKAGYIEVPSLLDELSWMIPEPGGGRWLGHDHHRWLCTLGGGELVFLSKFHSLHSRRSLRIPPRWARQLTVEDRVLSHFWTRSLPACERPAIDAYPFDELEHELERRFGARARLRRRALRAAGAARRQGARLVGR
jgi:SAM-dependent methyltransferase